MKTSRPALLGYLLVCLCFPALATVQLVPISELKPLPEHRRAAKLVTHFLANYHYSQPKLDDALSQVVFDNYLQALDPTRSYFLQSDIDEFSAYAREFDDDLKHAELQAVFGPRLPQLSIWTARRSVVRTPHPIGMRTAVQASATRPHVWSVAA